MNLSKLQLLTTRLEEAGQFPKRPFKAPNASDSLKSQQFEHADFFVDLKLVLDKAIALGASGFDIVADTVTIKGGSTINITGSVQLVTIIARRVVIEGEGGAVIILDHMDVNSIRSVNIIAAEIATGIAVVSQSATRQTYDLSHVKAPSNQTPKLFRFGWRDGKMREGDTAVPVGYLGWDQPLYKVLNATYALAAGMLGQQEVSAETLRLANNLLRWILSWSGLHADIGSLTRKASSILQLMPTAQEQADGQFMINYAMPSLTSEACLSLVKSRLDLAKQIELNAALANQAQSVRDIARRFAASLSQSHQIDAKALDDEIKTCDADLQSAQMALDRSSRLLEQQGVDQEIAKIQVNTANEINKIDRIAKASIDLAIAFAGFGLSIVAIATGTPGDPGASTKKGRDGVTGLFEAIKTAAAPTVYLPRWVDVLAVYLIPVTFAVQHASGHSEDLKKLATTGVAMKDAIQKINSSDGTKAQFDEIASIVGQAVQALSAKPGVAEALAAWDAIAIETTNQLDIIINDAGTSAEVKKATTDYKSSIQKMSIYGRLILEIQGRRDALTRHLGTLLLRRISAIEKADEIAKTFAVAPDEATLKQHIEAETAYHMDEARQAFFEACFGFRQAFFYETYEYPKAIPAFCETAEDMNQVYAAMETDSKSPRRPVRKFDRTFVVDAPQTLAQLQKGQAVPIEIPTNLPVFQGYSRVRLERMEMRLRSESKIVGLVGIRMDSQSLFTDLHSSGPIRIEGRPFDVKFEYDEQKVQLSNDFGPIAPPLFCTWTMQIYAPKQLPPISAVEVTLKGQSQ